MPRKEGESTMSSGVFPIYGRHHQGWEVGRGVPLWYGATIRELGKKDLGVLAVDSLEASSRVGEEPQIWKIIDFFGDLSYLRKKHDVYVLFGDVYDGHSVRLDTDNIASNRNKPTVEEYRNLVVASIANSVLHSLHEEYSHAETHLRPILDILLSHSKNSRRKIVNRDLVFRNALLAAKTNDSRTQLKAVEGKAGVLIGESHDILFSPNVWNRNDAARRRVIYDEFQRIFQNMKQIQSAKLTSYGWHRLDEREMTQQEWERVVGELAVRYSKTDVIRIKERGNNESMQDQLVSEPPFYSITVVEEIYRAARDVIGYDLAMPDLITLSISQENK